MAEFSLNGRPRVVITGMAAISPLGETAVSAKTGTGDAICAALGS